MNIRIGASAAQVSGIKQPRPVGTELGDNRACATLTAGQVSPRRGRKICGEGPPGYIGVAVAIHRDICSAVVSNAAQISGIEQGGSIGTELGDEHR